MITASTNDPPRRVRIGLLLHPGSPWSVDVAVSLADLGAEIFVIACEDLPAKEVGKGKSVRNEGLARLRERGIAVESLTRRRSQFGNVWTIAVALRKYRSRFNSVLCLYGGAFALAALLSGIRPYSIYWVGSDVLLAGGHRRFLSALAAHGASVNFANGHSLAEQSRRRFGLSRIESLYLGVDTDRFAPSSRMEPATAICTRWFEPVYDNAVIIDAFAALHQKIPAARITFTSSGSLLPDARARALRCPKANTARVFEFCGGVDGAELVDRLARTEIFVSMARSDGTSTAMLEALSIGLFPILSDIAANREWLITHGCDGILVAVGDVPGLARAVETAFNDKQRRLAAARWNRSVVCRLADARRNRRQLLATLTATQTTPSPQNAAR